MLNKSKHKDSVDFIDCVEKLSAVSECPEAEARFIFQELKTTSLSLQEILDLRLANQPLQYIFNSWQFRYLDLYLDSRVLIPRPETEVTVELALWCLKSLSEEKIRVLDLGCGTGAIGLSILKEQKSSVELESSIELVCVDISPEAIEVAQLNLDINFPETGNLSESIPDIQFKTGDWFKALDSNELFHLIVSNPPYISATEDLPKEVEDYEPEVALRSGVTGFEDVEQIILESKDWLFKGGWLVVELAPHQAHQAKELALSLNFQNVKIHFDLTGRQRILVAQN